MFKGSGSFTDVGNNVINTLLVDEAHRLNEKSGMFLIWAKIKLKKLFIHLYVPYFLLMKVNV